MSNVVDLPPPPTTPEVECREFPGLLRELTILINTHRGGTVVENLAAALRRILKGQHP